MSDNKLTNDTLLGMARNNLTVAKEMYKLYPDDNGIVNLVAYHLQQTIELALKHFFETHGIRYDRTHDISDLCSKIPDEHYDMFRDIDIYASKLTQMESKTRYLKSYSVAVREIKLGFDLANGIIDKLTKLEEAEDAQNAIEHEDS
ncbi:HEPN domain-containing protein [Selenomonas sp. AB3002]|uniref:HEPN domain-containing protein n=1 Tax=Selenomonas sp. AB3002 TaxID=1392502 RepID=UPI000495F68A